MRSATIATLRKGLADEMKSTGTWKDDCPVPLERLSLISIRYVDFEGNEHDDGELVALDAAAEYIASAFATLYAKRFPINKIKSVHHYSGDDELSMADNNTSCFCHRPIEGSSLASLHSYGLAIDINPLQNPFVFFDEEQGAATIHPKKGWEFLNRHNQKLGMVEDIVPVLAEHGFFIWGGRWTTPIDYHHFQPTRGMAELLMIINEDDAKPFFEFCIANKDQLRTMPSGERLEPLIRLYRKNRTEFFDSFFEHLDYVDGTRDNQA